MKSLKMLLGTICAIAFMTGSLFAGAINDKCPVSDRGVDEDHTVDVVVSFCCGNCKSKFDAEPAKFFEKVAAAEEGKCPLSGEDAASDKSSTLTIGVCCDKCETKLKEAPKKFITKVKLK
jgi:YHS domain-containing protein